MSLFWSDKRCFRGVKGDLLILTGPCAFTSNLICYFSLCCLSVPQHLPYTNLKWLQRKIPMLTFLEQTSPHRRINVYRFPLVFAPESTLDGITDKCMAVFSENFGSEIPCVFRETKWKGEAFCGFDPHTCSWSKTNAGVNRIYGLLPMSVAHWTTFWLTLLFLKTLMLDQINHGTVFRKEQTNWTREWERGLKSTLQASAPLRQCFLQLCNLSPLNAWIRLRSPPFPIP